jgi:hypothetical protein
MEQGVLQIMALVLVVVVLVARMSIENDDVSIIHEKQIIMTKQKLAFSVGPTVVPVVT